MSDALAYARSPERIQSKACLNAWCDQFIEIKGDRLEGDDPSVLCGLAIIRGIKCAVIAQYPGVTPIERMHTQSGMTRPMGYRKIHRLLELGKKFSVPLLCLIDTPGADASTQACRQNQSKLIADSMCHLAAYPHPSLGIILNQAMSGGAMAIAMTDVLWMCRHAIFSVISPEGCASILWRDPSQAAQAAERLKMYAQDIKSLGLVDALIDEAELLGYAEQIAATLTSLLSEDPEERLNKRMHRWDFPC